MNTLAYTFRRKFILIDRDKDPVLYRLAKWIVEPIKLLRIGWKLTSPKTMLQPIKNGIHRRCYRALKHTYNHTIRGNTWINRVTES